MAKQGGMGDNLYVDQFDVSGDIGSIQRVAGPLTVQVNTNITQSGTNRIGLQHDGAIDYTAYWNPTTAVTLDSEHDVLKALPLTDRNVSYFRSTVLGAPAASLVSKQVNYDGSRAQDGSLLFNTSAVANGFGLEWGNNLTAGKKTDTVAANGSTVDLGAVPISYAFGWAAYLHVFAFTGTSVTVKIQDSADGTAWTDLTGAGFTAATAKGKERIASASATATVRRYARVVSSGTFSNAVFAVNFVRYEIGGHA
jgi:hypothetical protein